MNKNNLQDSVASELPYDSPSEILKDLYLEYCDDGISQHQKRSSYLSFNLLRKVPILNRLLPKVSEKALEIDRLMVEQKQAVSYNQWYDISSKLDSLLDYDAWKEDPVSDLYNYKLLQQDLDDMRSARESKDFQKLLYLIRTKWYRNVGTMGDLDLYRHSYVGTKRLIEEYCNECIKSLNCLINDKSDSLDRHYLLGMLIQTRKNIGRTALVLSGGSTFGLFHIGVLITLFEQNLLPRIISGSSSGSIIACLVCCRTNDEIPELLRAITDQDFIIFGDQMPGKSSKFKNLLDTLRHLLKYGTLFDMAGLKKTIYSFVGDLTFREAYNMTGKILNITVSPASIHEQIKLINYLTAPNCLVWSVVCASCSLPGVFPSTTIFEKDPRTNEIHEWNNDIASKYVDGSVDNDLPIMRLLEMFNVDHIIAVQVNPHVAPVLKMSVSSIGGDVENELSSKFKSFVNNVYDYFTCEIIHYLQIMHEMDFHKNLSNKMISILSQSYSGNITILPDIKLGDFKWIFGNPTPHFLVDLSMRGARASWPKMTLIKNHCGVEFALDKAISQLRGTLISSNLHPSKTLPLANALRESTRQKSPYYMLVNSPESDKNRYRLKSLTPDKDTHQRSRSYISRDFSGSASTIARPKRNSISGGSTIQPKRTKGKSFTCLSGMDDRVSQRHTVSFSNASSKRRSELEYNKELGLLRNKSDIDNPYFKRTQSSTSFLPKLWDNLDGYSGRPDRSTVVTSPMYLDSPSRTNSRKTSEGDPRDEANYPKINEPPKSPFNSLRDTSLPRTRTNSNYNLNLEYFKSLNSPDLRRSLKRTPQRESKSNIMASPYPHTTDNNVEGANSDSENEDTSRSFFSKVYLNGTNGKKESLDHKPSAFRESLEQDVTPETTSERESVGDEGESQEDTDWQEAVGFQEDLAEEETR